MLPAEAGKDEEEAMSDASGFLIFHGNRVENLRQLAVTWLGREPLPPLVPECFLVQGNAMAQWLRLALAAGANEGGYGVAAALEFSLPSTFLWRCYRAVLGAKAVPERSPFDLPLLRWRLLRLLGSLPQDPVYEPLRRFLAEETQAEEHAPCEGLRRQVRAERAMRKRDQLAGRIAELFDQYQVYRADWLQDWGAGRDVLRDAHGTESPLEEGQRWQAALWRLLCADVARTDPGAERTARSSVHSAFLEAVGTWQGPPPPGLPRRLVVFGISSLPQQWVEALAALGRWIPVLLFVHNPCRYHWADVVDGRELLRQQEKWRRRRRRREGQPDFIPEAELHRHGHPLLAAWGKQGRDFIALLDEFDEEAVRQRYAGKVEGNGGRLDWFEAPEATNTLLQQLQEDILELRPLAETRERWPGVDLDHDRSLVFHVAHGPQREVEVLHDQLRAAFDEDPTLRPDEVIVMVPDIEVYAPHIEAVFGAIEPEDPRHIPFSLADQGLRARDPLLQGLELLLDLPQGRARVGEVLDLLDVPALRRRFGIDDEALPRLRSWVEGAQIRWGLNGDHRRDLGLGEQGGGEWLEQNSWRFGLERMLYGYAAGDAPAWRGVEPFDEVGGLEAGLVGPLAEVLEALETARRQLREPLTPSEWGERLQALLARFFAAGDDEETVTLMRLETALQDWVEACAAAGLEERLPLAVVREPWLERLEEQGLSQRFFAGRVIFATLMPMRAIPFRHVYLLGMNDGDYPRARVPSDFDLMAGNYRPGDRSRREDDRYLFLEALLSARERFYVSWVGHRITDNAPQPPSVLVAQLREHLAAGWTGHRAGKKEPVQGEDLLAALTTEHRLQPFSPAYFPHESAQGALFTYAREWRARREAEPRAPSGPLQPPVLEEPLRVRELAQFLRHPVRSFLRDRLGVFLELEDPGSEEAEPFALDGLTLWSLRQEVIDAQRVALRQGRDVAAVRRAAIGRIRRRGVLPAGELGALWVAELEEGMDELFARYQEALTPWPVEHAGGEEVRFAADGLELADWLGEWRRNGEGERARVLISPSELVKDGKYRPDRLAGYWVQHLAANAGTGPTWTVVLSRVGDYTFAPLGVAAAEPLAALLRAWAEGMRRPLPFAFQTALAWWKAWCKAPNKGEEEAWEAARKAYEGNGWTVGERDQDPYLARAWPRFADLRASGEFAHWAEVLLGPLLQYMEATKEGKKGAQA